MKYSVQYSSRFKKSLKRVQALPGFKATRLKAVIQLLSEGESLPADYKDHKLKGSLKYHRECHVSPDILLIYQVTDGLLMLTLVNIGNHSQLFK
jgi:mRNA interferase YafQ